MGVQDESEFHGFRRLPDGKRVLSRHAVNVWCHLRI